MHTQNVIARDENQHAELAWSTLAWVWQKGDAAQKDLIRGLIDEVPTQAAFPDPAGADKKWLLEHGYLAGAARREVAERETTRAVERADALLV